MKNSSKKEYIWTSKNVSTELNDINRTYYIDQIKKYFNRYLLEGTVSLSSDDIINLFSFSENELFVLKSAHYLINENVNEFFIQLPYLLRNLAHSTKKDNVESKGIVRGKIDWNDTIKTRCSQGLNDSSIFVSNFPLKNYDLTENRILKFLLKRIIVMFEENLKFIHDSDDKINLNHLNDDSASWYDKINTKYHFSKHSLQNVYFNGIGNLDFASSTDFNKLFFHRNPIYHKLGLIFKLYEKLFIIDDDECLIDLIQNQLIVASNNDTLFEIYVLFNIISFLEENSVENTFKLGLFYKNNNNPITAETNDNSIIKIYYHNLPQEFEDNSLYRELTKDNQFNFKTKIRMPDIVVEIIKDGVSYFRIIEVKNSSESKYMNKSLYKVLGYYKDFEKVNFTKNIPIVVVNWNGSSISKNLKEKIFKQDVIFLNKEEFIEYIEKLIKI